MKHSQRGRIRILPTIGVLCVTALASVALVNWLLPNGAGTLRNVETQSADSSGSVEATVPQVSPQQSSQGEADGIADGTTLAGADRVVAEGPTAEDAEASAGMRVYVNPNTGQFEEPPADVRAAMAAADGNRVSTSAAGLQQRPSSVPGGGVIVDLEGRFQSPVVATVSPDGQLNVGHAPEVIHPQGE